jgi:hypothetical protein
LYSSSFEIFYKRFGRLNPKGPHSAPEDSTDIPPIFFFFYIVCILHIEPHLNLILNTSFQSFIFYNNNLPFFCFEVFEMLYFHSIDFYLQRFDIILAFFPISVILFPLWSGPYGMGYPSEKKDGYRLSALQTSTTNTGARPF